MNILERSLRKTDAYQQRNLVPSFIYGVIKKYSDDNGGVLVIQLTYTMFITVFPLLLLLITILTLVLTSDPSAKHAVLNSTFKQFPAVGSQLGNNIHNLKRDSTISFIIGLVVLVYGAMGLASAGLYVMAQVWNIRGPLRPNYIKRLARSLIFLVVLASGLVITTVLSGFGTFGRHNFWLGIVSEILALALNIGLYLAAYRTLTPKPVATKSLIPGSIFAGTAWTILQAFGSYVVGHYLRHDNATYGIFGTVLGLIAWIYLGSLVTVYGAEINAVLKRHLWPRSIIQPPLTKADQESIALQATQNQRRPEQIVITKIKGKPMTQQDYLNSDGKLNKQKIGTVKAVPKRNKHLKKLV